MTPAHPRIRPSNRAGPGRYPFGRAPVEPRLKKLAVVRQFTVSGPGIVHRSVHRFVRSPLRGGLGLFGSLRSQKVNRGRLGRTTHRQAPHLPRPGFTVYLPLPGWKGVATERGTTNPDRRSSCHARPAASARECLSLSCPLPYLSARSHCGRFPRAHRDNLSIIKPGLSADRLYLLRPVRMVGRKLVAPQEFGKRRFDHCCRSNAGACGDAPDLGALVRVDCEMEPLRHAVFLYSGQFGPVSLARDFPKGSIWACFARVT